MLMSTLILQKFLSCCINAAGRSIMLVKPASSFAQSKHLFSTESIPTIRELRKKLLSHITKINNNTLQLVYYI